jgi:hypothetical protein
MKNVEQSKRNGTLRSAFFILHSSFFSGGKHDNERC